MPAGCTPVPLLRGCLTTCLRPELAVGRACLSRTFRQVCLARRAGLLLVPSEASVLKDLVLRVSWGGASSRVTDVGGKQVRSYLSESEVPEEAPCVAFLFLPGAKHRPRLRALALVRKLRTSAPRLRCGAPTWVSCVGCSRRFESAGQAVVRHRRLPCLHASSASSPSPASSSPQLRT